jgi:hypothetical protein
LPRTSGAESHERRHLPYGNAAAFWLIWSTTCPIFTAITTTPTTKAQSAQRTHKENYKFEPGISFAFSSLCVLCDLCVFVVKIVTHRLSYPIHQHRHAGSPTRPCTTGCSRTARRAHAGDVYMAIARESYLCKNYQLSTGQLPRLNAFLPARGPIALRKREIY